MATYFHGGSEIQADNLQTLYLMNPNYVTYSDHQPPPQQPQNMLVLNAAATAASGSHALNPGCIPYGQPQSHQQFVGIPLSGSVGSESDDPSRPSPSSLQSLVPRVHYNLWTSVDPANCGPDVAQQMGFRRPQPGHHQQGLSLTLSAAGQNPVTVVSPRTRDEASVSNGGVAVPQSGIIGSKYLKAAQELLDEVVHVGKGVQKGDLEVEGGKEKVKTAIEAVAGEAPCGGGGGESKRAAELTTAQRQELQMKKAKLLSMLDEVEQRYRQYHAQMQMVVAAFEQVAGPGSAKSYTALALQTISKQFRCLKDAITTQIKGTSKSLGEMEVGAKVEGSSSRLKFVDHQLRQQRALQQLGMIQHNAWRPQRGLPERAVSVLRAWLFEHFLHPYPKDSDKHMLAKQTGLTRSQVSNWFINARVRLWKPMVEEMYTEEMKHQAHDPTGSASEPATTDPSKDSTVTLPTGPPPKPPQDHRETPPIHHTQNPNHSANSIPNITVATSPQGFSLIGSASDVIKESTYMETMMQRSPKRNRTTDQMRNSPSSILSMDMEIKPTDPHHPHHHHHHHHQHQMGAEQRHHAVTSNLINSSMGFNTYPPHLSDIGRFNGDHLAHRYHHGNGVSLTLGLPHCENLSLAGTQQNYLPSHTMQLGRMDGGGGEPDFCGLGSAQPSHSSVGYESIDIQNRKRFAAQLLPDFVA